MQQVTFPLQLLASRLATALLELVGVPVLRQGNMIVLAAMPLDVAEACSGIRSLLTLVTLAIIYGYLLEIPEVGAGGAGAHRRCRSQWRPTAFASLAPGCWCSTGTRTKQRDFSTPFRDG